MKYNTNYIICINNEENNIRYNIDELFFIKKYKTKDKIKIKIQRTLCSLPIILFEFNSKDDINEYIIDYYIYKLIYAIKNVFKIIKNYNKIKLNKSLNFEYKIILGNNIIKINLSKQHSYYRINECVFNFLIHLNNTKYIFNNTIIKKYTLKYLYKDKKVKEILV